MHTSHYSIIRWFTMSQVVLKLKPNERTRWTLTVKPTLLRSFNQDETLILEGKLKKEKQIKPDIKNFQGMNAGQLNFVRTSYSIMIRERDENNTRFDSAQKSGFAKLVDALDIEAFSRGPLANPPYANGDFKGMWEYLDKILSVKTNPNTEAQVLDTCRITNSILTDNIGSQSFIAFWDDFHMRLTVLDYKVDLKGVGEDAPKVYPLLTNAIERGSNFWKAQMNLYRATYTAPTLATLVTHLTNKDSIRESSTASGGGGGKKRGNQQRDDSDEITAESSAKLLYVGAATGGGGGGKQGKNKDKKKGNRQRFGKNKEQSGSSKQKPGGKPSSSPDSRQPKGPSTGKRANFLRCLNCGSPAHKSWECDASHCSWCGKLNDHTSYYCPERTSQQKNKGEGGGKRSAPAQASSAEDGNESN